MKRITDRQWREAASRLYGQTNRLTVSTWGNIHRMHDGAFVDMVAWVPNATVATDEEKEPPRE